MEDHSNEEGEVDVGEDFQRGALWGKGRAIGGRVCA